MAQLVRDGKPSPCSQLAPHGHRVPNDAQNKGAGVALSAGDICYLKQSDGKIYKSIASAQAEAASFHGMCPTDIPAGEPVSLFHDERFDYTSTVVLVPGKSYFVSDSVAGGLQDTPPYPGALPVCYAIDETRVQLLMPFDAVNTGYNTELATVLANIPQAAEVDLVAATGVADGTVADVGGAFNQATLNNNFQDLATKVNAILTKLRAAGIIAP
jgi:hypothetical protein